MKIEHLLAQHFFNSKELTLQGIGTFTLSPDFVMPKESDKDLQLPDNVINFQYNSHAGEDEALVDFIVLQSRKMKSLAAADLDSYLVLGKQFLNIGKPFKIKGIGILLKNQQGEYIFKQGHDLPEKAETEILISTNTDNDKNEPSISFASQNKPQNNSKKGLVIAAAIIVIGLLGATTWYFINKKKSNIDTAVTPPIEVRDTTIAAKTSTDSIMAATVSTKIPKADSFSFKVVFMITQDSLAAVARMNKQITRGHKIIMYKNDSLGYKLAEPFTLPLSDTTHIKDSLNSFYYLGKAFIEL